MRSAATCEQGSRRDAEQSDISERISGSKGVDRYIAAGRISAPYVNGPGKDSRQNYGRQNWEAQDLRADFSSGKQISLGGSIRQAFEHPRQA
jgi:hypothetical protein